MSNPFASFGSGVKKTERTPKPLPGTHIIEIMDYGVLKTLNHGEVPHVKTRLITSSTDEVGAERGDIWFIHQSGWPGKFALGEAEAFVQACMASLGQDPNDKTALQKTAAAMATEKQPARGLRLKCVSVERTSKQGNEVINTTYTPIPQTAAEVKAQRAAQESGEVA